MSSTSALSLSNRGDFDLGWLKPAELITTSAAMGGELGSAGWQSTPKRLAAMQRMNSIAAADRCPAEMDVKDTKATSAMLRGQTLEGRLRRRAPSVIIFFGVGRVQEATCCVAQLANGAA